ncbi:MAG: DMT family transporter [Eubacteriales bacterium]|nr:DMT family transporter [Eubacteriales bacterium]
MGKRQKPAIKYILFLVIAIAAFSSFEVVSKPTVFAISPAQLTFYRFLVGGCVLLPFAYQQLKKRNIRLKAKDILLFCGLGFCLVCVSLNLAQYGIQFANASMSAVIFSSNPLFTALLAVPILKERFSLPKLAGLLLGVIGLVVTCLHLFSGETQIDSGFLAGIVLIFIGMFAFALYTVCSKAMAKRFGGIPVITFSSIFGSLLMIPILFLLNESGGNPFVFQLSAIVPQFLYLSLIGTALAYYCYFDAIAHLNTSLGSMSFFIKPGLASLLCAVILHEPITPNIIIGIILIMCGLFLSIHFEKTRK